MRAIRARGAVSESERAALAYAEEVVLNIHLNEVTFERLRRAFSETEIVQITWLCACTAYFNRMAIPLGMGSDGLCGLASAA